MYNVLLVVENRKLLERLYTYLEDESLYNVDILPFSTSTFDRFVEMRAEIVVIDSDVIIPYQTILKQLQQSQWTYRAVLLRDKADHNLKDPNVIFVEREGLTAEKFLHTLDLATQMEEASQTEASVVLNWKGHIEFTSYPDVYYILLMKYVGEGGKQVSQADLDQIRAETAYIGEIEVIVADGQDLLCSMRKAKIRSGYEFSGLGKLLLSILGKDYAVIYHENVKWSVLEEAYTELTSHAVYGYFCRGESLSVHQLHQPARFLAEQKLYARLVDVLDAALHGAGKEVERHLKTLYLYDLKPSLDLNARRYIRWTLVLLLGILESVAGDSRAPRACDSPSVEAEFSDVNERVQSLSTILLRRILPENVILAMIRLFSDYRESLSLDGVAEDLHINKIYLGRVFREQTGMTVVHFLQHIRTHHALYLLSDRQYKIGDASRLVGYQDPGYFSKIFKKTTGLSPVDYRQQILKRDDKEDIIESIVEIGGQLSAIL